MIAERLVSRYARAYARHAGLPLGGLAEEARRRLACMEPWARVYAGASAAFVLWAAPALLLRRLKSFEGLSEDEREELLARLLRAEPPLRAAFLGARALALACCYGRK